MRKLVAVAFVVAQTVLLSGCGGVLSSASVREILNRTVEVLERYDRYMVQYDYKSLTPVMTTQLETWLNQSLNRAPRVHDRRILTRMNADASIHGYGDQNGNGRIDQNDKRLFKIEIDTSNNRVIATAEGGSSYGQRPRGAGFMTGLFIGSMLNRQRAAGITPNHFASRSVYRSSGPSPRTMRTTSSARGRARSGGVFRGK